MKMRMTLSFDVDVKLDGDYVLSAPCDGDTVRDFASVLLESRCKTYGERLSIETVKNPRFKAELKPESIVDGDIVRVKQSDIFVSKLPTFKNMAVTGPIKL